MPREVDFESVKNFALANGIDGDSIIETSAKTGLNVSAVFERVAAYYVPVNTGNVAPGSVDIKEDQNQNPKSKKCC